MNTRDQLNQYLQGLEKRMRWLAVSKGAAVAAGVALGATLALVLITNALAFSSTSMTVARVVLFVALAAAVGFALVIPLMHLNRRKAAGRAETSFPEFQERLLTYVERSEKRDPMLDLLAMDTMSVAAENPARAGGSSQIDFRAGDFGGRRRGGVVVADPGGSRIPGLRRIACCGPERPKPAP